VVDIKEKVKISDLANTGCYCFKNGVELAKYCELIIENGITQLSQDMQGEFYTSGVIKAMLDDKIPCKQIDVGTGKTISLSFIIRVEASTKLNCSPSFVIPTKILTMPTSLHLILSHL
jgi:hypothetical protein